jgi:hypothetical protein
MIHVTLPKAGNRSSWLNSLPPVTRKYVVHQVFKQANDIKRPVNIRLAGQHWAR